MDNLDNSVSQRSNGINFSDGAKSIGLKRGSGDVSQLCNSNQKRKVKTKEELALLRKQMMKSRFKSGLGNHLQPQDGKSVADDVSG